ncbi:MAG TPA: tetratricopeptide repeat protein [Xanthobacteraceae bacterium]
MNRAASLVCAVALALCTVGASARELSKEEIICALDPGCGKSPSRDLPRGVTASGGGAAAAPSVDLYVNFGYDSADLTSDARITLDRLGAALRDSRLDRFGFLIAGHTDAKGSADYNQGLSERRADAVRRYLISQHGIASARLSSIGYGSSQLLDPTRPEDGVNRRVRVVNVTSGRGREAAAAPSDDHSVCARAAGEESIAACSRRIGAGELGGRDLAVAYRNRGWALHSSGDDDRAIVDYNEALRLDPNYAHALANRGVAWRAKGDRGRAFADFDEAVRRKPDYAYAFAQRAYTRDAEGDHDRAIADYNEAIRLNPRDAFAFNNRGNAFRSKGEHERAIADYNEALRLDPKYATALANRGRAWRDKGDAARALSDLDEAIRLQPRNGYAWFQRAYTFQARGDNERALADYTESIRFNPKDAVAFNNRGNAWRSKGDNERALADYNEALRINPRYVVALNNRGNAWKTKGDIERAIADYDEAIRVDPGYALAWGNRGNAWRSKRNFDRALGDLTEAIRRDPGFSAAFTHRGMTYESRGQLAQARSDFNATLALPPKYDNGKWAQDTARARLALLSPHPGTTPAPPPPPVAGPAAGGDRIALVIGNGAYANAPRLPNPPNDAREIADALRNIGFSVIAATDLDRNRMELTIRDFLRKTSSARVAVLFYAGHGVAIDGRNYLVPIDTREINRATVNFELVDVDRILAGLDDEARANIVLLDACRDNPLETRSASGRAMGRGSGLAPYSTVASGMLIAFATAPGKTAADGAGAHSPFTAALLKHLSTPRLEINQMLTRVRVDVVEATRREQVPWTNSSLLGEIYLNEGSAPAKAGGGR